MLNVYLCVVLKVKMYKNNHRDIKLVSVFGREEFMAVLAFITSNCINSWNQHKKLPKHSLTF
jgi:hypothetical protein